MKRKEFVQLVVISILISAFIFIAFVDEKTFPNFLLSCAISLMYSTTIGYGNHLITSFLEKKYPWERNMKKRAIITIFSIIIVNVLLVYSTNFINYVLIQKALTAKEFFTTSKINFINWFYINIALLISAFLHAKSFREELQESKRKEIVEQKFIANSANAQFETLKNQLDPHFLFNSLNVLSSLIEENPKQAQKFTASMSKVYRYVLEQKDKEIVTVEEEIEFAKTYCSLLKMRFEDSVDFIFGVQEEYYERLVVPLSLQLLLENCIKHNFATSTKPLIINISTENNTLCIQNNLQIREQLKESAGIGLANIIQRYSLLTDKNLIIEKSEEYFKVKLPLLTQKSEIMNITEKDTDQAYKKAKKRVKEIKDFYTYLIVYAISIPFFIILNHLTTPDNKWSYFPILIGGVGAIIQAFSIFTVGHNWEEKKVKELMKKNK